MVRRHFENTDALVMPHLLVDRSVMNASMATVVMAGVRPARPGALEAP